jgi:hypothetical protein
VSIVEGPDETESQVGPVSELGAAISHDLSLDPFRGFDPDTYDRPGA